MPQIYTIEINITCVPLYFWGRFLNSAESVGVRTLTKAVPDASSHSFFKCPTYGAGELLVPPLSGLAKKKQRVKKKKRAGKKQHLPGETIQGIGGRERRVKWVQFQRGNNGGRGVWCSYPGHENDSVDDGINHTSAALNVNEDVFACFLVFLITIASIQPSSRPDEGGWGGGADLSAATQDDIGWRKQSYLKCFCCPFSCARSFSCVFVVMSGRKVKMEFILWYRLPVQTREMLTQGDITLVSALCVPSHLSFPVS